MAGCLMYLTTTRPNILYVVSLVSRLTSCATNTHFRAAKRVIRYVKRTLNFGIKFYANQKCVLQGYSDSDWAGSSDDMKSPSSYCFNIGSGVFSEIVAQSTAEVEFIAAAFAANQALEKDAHKEGSVRLKYCKTDLQLADMFTKALLRSRFEFLREALGICSN
ncbi:secreted RxLR effector protein 161-like [Lycium barbarum]|uniref:secreted RxLR effector protein 161-like n=1 Tax=Lycium barbarum TaxID=112863 RepID=UPI00293EDC3C|nr:secreted RxLR effector protein 161-like [Lycium barbarum]